MTADTLCIAMAQINPLVGDIEGNTQQIIDYAHQAKAELNADLIVFPELTLTGYPPEDLLLRKSLYARIDSALKRICGETQGIGVIIGYPEQIADLRYNTAAFIDQGKIRAAYHKQQLPNYSVFDEKRYFTPGNTPCIIDIKGVSMALSICEDLWSTEPIKQYIAAGAKMIISLNASPFHQHQAALRHQMLLGRIETAKVPIIYVNQVGGQDELVFDGGSLAINAQGEICAHAGFFKEDLLPVTFDLHHQQLLSSITSPPEPSTLAHTYDALVLGVRDYIEKNQFAGAVIALSGGIDSALTLAIAVDAIGKERVEVLMMPSIYTQSMSTEDASIQANMLGVRYAILPIMPIFNRFVSTLADEFSSYPTDVTEENLQARIRGTLLMAMANKKKLIALSTSNKSETAVGYTTLYGDMVGGFCVLKDVTKTWVYQLAAYRNQISPAIPQRVIERPPSAELAPNQTDQDTLPPYDILDEILTRYVEVGQSVEEITQAGFEQATVESIVHRIKKNEHKRRQAPPGPRITSRAFGRDRRHPITSGF